MSEFFVFRSRDSSIGPSFNEASQILHENAAVKVISENKKQTDRGVILIETEPKAIDSIQKQLPGWKIEPSIKYYPC